MIPLLSCCVPDLKLYRDILKSNLLRQKCRCGGVAAPPQGEGWKGRLRQGEERATKQPKKGRISVVYQAILLAYQLASSYQHPNRHPAGAGVNVSCRLKPSRGQPTTQVQKLTANCAFLVLVELSLDEPQHQARFPHRRLACVIV